MPYRVLTLLVLIVLLMSTTIRAEDNPHLVVAWVENSDVLVWRTGDASPTRYAIPESVSGNTRQLLISSDGQYVVLNSAYPASLWMVTPTDPNLVELVPNQALPTTDDPKFLQIGNLQRGANNAFYFNTANHPSHYTLQNNDLWQVDAPSRSFKLLLPPSEGGLFNISPDGQHIAIVQSGTYGTADGKISLIDVEGQSRQDVLTFPAVSTASDYDFYPPLFWLADGSAFKVAIPDKELVYHDDNALTALWQIRTDGTKTQIGSLQASFFGLPQWSDDGQYLIYLRHKGDITSNQFELIVATGDGSKPIVYANGLAGSIGFPQWLPKSDQFIYSQGEAGDYWLGQPNQPPKRFPGKIFNPHFVDSTTYVFTTASGDTFELRYARLGGVSSTLIATVRSAVPIFDALLVP